MNRRQFVTLSSVTVLAACTGTQAAVDLQVVNDVASIASGLAGSLSVLSGMPIFGQISQDVTLLQQLANELTPGTSASAAKTTVQKVEDVINDIVSIAAGLPLPPPFGLALAAANFLLPIIESLVGLALSKPAAAKYAARLQGSMTAVDARAILAAAAHGR